jgi:5-methylcytosine-specific restriction endonuclease McrA
MTYSQFERRERKKLFAHSDRSKKFGLVADLSYEDWHETVCDFNGLCAYCQSRPYEEIDHFIPVSSGGPTTVNNCVPSCKLCNEIKARQHPSTIQSNRFFDIDGVRSYLSKRQARDETYWINISEWYSSAETKQMLKEVKYIHFSAEDLWRRGVLKVHFLSYDTLYYKKSVDVFCRYKREEVDSSPW